MIIKRTWAMPNSNTFEIKAIRNLIYKYIKPDYYSIDPFANKSRIAKITNDLNPEMKCDYSMDALDFMMQFNNNSIDFLLYDPPYSLRQVSECYKNVGIEVTTETTQSNWRSKHINEISRIMKQGGIVMCFGWNSAGIGKTRDFNIIEILMVSHGGSHNDTIVTVEKKNNNLFNT